METFDILLAVAAVALVALATAWRDFGDKPKAVVTWTGVTVFFTVYCLIALYVAYGVVQASSSPLITSAGAVFALAWIGWGTLCVLRYLPAAKDMPNTLKRPFGLLGTGLLLLIAAAGFILFARF